MKYNYDIPVILVLLCAFHACIPCHGADPIGKQLADYARTDTSQQGQDCYKAVYNRLKHIFDKNNKTLPGIYAPADELKQFKMLWNTNFDYSNWTTISPTYRACGPAGALVAESLATLVNHSGIWNGNLKPGAIVQVWDVWDAGKPSGDKAKGTAVFNALHAGTDYAKKVGHSFIFLEYKRNSGGQITGMTIADQGTPWNQPATITEKTFGLWIGANVKD